MQGMLSILLFAGALHVDLSELKAYRWPVGLLALFGTGATMMLLGLGVVAIPLPPGLLPAGMAAILLVLGARLLTVGVPVALTRRIAGLPHGAWQVLTWGGLRGGVSVALALSLPAPSATWSFR